MNPYGNYGGFNSAAYNNYINPMQPQIDRLNQMQQAQQMQQPQYQQPTQPQQPQGQTIIPVGSIEEVKAHPVDWSGNANYFIDNVNKKIYVKQLGMNGAPVTSVYTLDTEPSETNATYVTKEEYKTLKSELDNYKGVLDNLLNQLGGNKKDEQ